MNDYIAHSAIEQFGTPEQSYANHVQSVRALALKHADEMFKYLKSGASGLRTIIDLAATYHDMGKLIDDCQKVLSGEETNRKMVNHVDAGVAHLMNKYKESGCIEFFFAAILIEGHHLGILNKKYDDNNSESGWSIIDCQERNFVGDTLRDTRIAKDVYKHLDTNSRVCDFVDHYLDDIIYRHQESMSELLDVRKPTLNNRVDSLKLRMATSCLIDADHADTAKHNAGYAIHLDTQHYPLRADERLKALDQHEKQLNANANYRTRISRIRRGLFRDCRQTTYDNGLYLCDAHVGSGKTFSTLAGALKAAKDNDLRRVIYIAPFTNIIDQVVEQYRKSIVLEDERFDEEKIVAAHHHRNEYKDQLVKTFSVTWDSPIVVTTAVQFFESLATNKTVPLKKLHKIPGSAIVIDEFHNAMPPKMWGLALKWLNQLITNWGCHIILSSGSPIEFWNIDIVNEIANTNKKSKKLLNRKPKFLVSEKTKQLLESRSEKRVVYEKIDEPHDAHNFHKLLNRKRKGPFLVICNTVKNAAVLAQMYKNNYGADKVEHISSALTPLDRLRILNRVKSRLNDPNDNDWVLFATSCIESGVDISFPTAFIEARSLMAVEQVSGRVNREDKMSERPVVIFKLDTSNEQGSWLNHNTSFNNSIEVLDELFNEVDGNLKACHCTSAMDHEVNRKSGFQQDVIKMVGNEDKLFLKEVEGDFQLIGDFSASVYMGAAYLDNELNQDLLDQIKDPSIYQHDVFQMLTHQDINKSHWRAPDVYKNLMMLSCPVPSNRIDQGEYRVITLDEVLDVPENYESELYRMDPTRLMMWGGAYDPDFLGYMAEGLYQLGVPGVERPHNPGDNLRQIQHNERSNG